MSNAIIARPYAKAAYQFAKKHQALSNWATMLNDLSFIMKDDRASVFLRSPSVSKKKQLEFLSSLTQTSVDEHGINFLKVLIYNNRLFELGEISEQYKILQAEDECTQLVDVTSAFPIDAAQEEKIKQTFAKRLQKSISIQVKIDPSLIGGMIIRAGDYVVDYSLRSQLQQLTENLV